MVHPLTDKFLMQKQGNYSLRRPPKLIIPPMFNEQSGYSTKLYQKSGAARGYIRSRVQHEVILEVRCSTKLY